MRGRVLRLTLGVLVLNDLFGAAPARLNLACRNGRALARIGVTRLGHEPVIMLIVPVLSLLGHVLTLLSCHVARLRSHPGPMAGETPHLRGDSCITTRNPSPRVGIPSLTVHRRYHEGLTHSTTLRTMRSHCGCPGYVSPAVHGPMLAGGLA